jgi:hypothetical protein
MDQNKNSGSVDGAWFCPCGADTETMPEHFWASDTSGRVVMSSNDWDGRTHVCDVCGTVADLYAFRVVGVRA